MEEKITVVECFSKDGKKLFEWDLEKQPALNLPQGTLDVVAESKTTIEFVVGNRMYRLTGKPEFIKEI